MRSSLVAISFLVLLVSSVLVSPSSAQGGSTGDGTPQDESLVRGTLDPVVIATDPAGDASAGIVPMPPEDVTESSAHLDIVELSMAENEQTFLLSIKHDAYPDLTAETSKVPFGASLSCDIWWDLNDGEDVRFGTWVRMENAGDAWQLSATASYRERESESDWDSDYLGEVPAALVAGDHVEIALSKALLEQGSGRPFRTGDTFDTFSVWCYGGQTAFAFSYDYIEPEETPVKAFPITLTANTDKIAMTLADQLQAGSQQVPVGVGTTTKVAVLIENLARNKLLVNITAEVVDGDGNVLPDWTVQAAPVFEVSSGRTVPASVLITPPEDAQHRSTALLKVRGVALGFPGEAKLSRELVAIEGPTPEKNTLYFHNWDADWFYCNGICGMPEGTTDQVFDEDAELFLLNVLADDPAMDREAQDSGPVALGTSTYAYAALDSALPRPVRFDDEGTVDFTITVRADVPRDVRLSATLFGGFEGNTVANFNEVFAITDTFTAHTFSVPVYEEDLRLPKGSYLYLENLRLRDEAEFNIFASNAMGAIEWDPSGTEIVLPLKEVVEAELKITDGRFLPSISLANDTDAEEYVNPGNSRAFDLELLNEGLEEDVVTLEATVSDPAWTVTFDPGRSFKLEPGRAAPLCVTVTAPEDAGEGDVIDVNLTARSKSDAEVTTSTRLSLLVTNGLPIDDDPCVEIEEERFVAPEAVDEKESPGVGVLLPLALLGLVAALRRRT